MKNGREILTFLNSRKEEMFALLKEMVLIQSGSTNKKGVDSVAGLIRASFSENCVEYETIPQTELGNHLIVSSCRPGREERQALLIGHMDTVYPDQPQFQWFKEDENYIYGPGVIDMKGGLVAGIYAVKALEDSGWLERIPVTFFLNSDEEIGSVSSKDRIRKEAKKSLFAFVLECAGENGEIVTGRKGNLRLKLDVQGRSGHAAFAGAEKGSAILELAHKIIALEFLNDHKNGITLNAGKIEGGIGPNTVPSSASAFVDVRFKTTADLDFLEKQFSQIQNNQKTAHTKCRIEKIGGRPPMEQSPMNRHLFHMIQTVARRFNITVAEEYRKGVSDANTVAQEQVPVVDGLGPIGSGDHSEEERMLKESLVPRTALIACSLIELWPNYLETLQKD
ncbi:MAG: M20 family metallopeptidase [Thermodesulfobacteriota bacterium]